MKGEANRRITQILKDNPRCTIPDLARDCQVSRVTVDRAVYILTDVNQIVTSVKIYYLTFTQALLI